MVMSGNNPVLLSSTPTREGKGRVVAFQEHSANSVQSVPSQGNNVCEIAMDHKVTARAFMPTRVNAEISQHYAIEGSEIGAGAFGQVFTATDKEHPDRKVAIKKMLIFDGEQKEAFEKEAQIMKDLDHPNICKLLETYQKGRFMFFVMEYCEGKDVFDRMMEEENNLLGEPRTSDIVRQAASALHYAHNRGIAHRDMKPENMVFASLDKSINHIKVIDWGLGFHFGDNKMKSAVGSLSYAAPEVLQAGSWGSWGSGYSASCDLWSLGVVTYVLLCGKPPFWGNQNEQLRAMKKERYPMNDEIWRAISPEAKDFIKGLLKVNEKKRLNLDKVLAHRWFTVQNLRSSQLSPQIASRVLSNMRNFSNLGHFYSICVTAVARQLDHRSLRDVHKVFCDLDKDGDGVLTLNEVRSGFEHIYAKDSQQMRDLEEMFARIDLDGSGTIDYTEFCAAGVGERVFLEEGALWAAFEAFDVGNHDGTITVDEIVTTLKHSDVQKVWGQETLESVAKEAMQTFDKDGDGCITFEEWRNLIREHAEAQKEQRLSKASGECVGSQAHTEASKELRRLETKLLGAAPNTNVRTLNRAYTIVQQMQDAERKATASGALPVTMRCFAPCFARAPAEPVRM